MSLRPCEECGNQISSDAKVCPQCGKKQRKQRKSQKTGWLILLGLIVILAIGGYENRNIGTLPKPSPVEDARLARAATGAHMIWQSATDPYSFNLRSVLIMSDGTVCYNYSAKNAFGGEVAGWAVFSQHGEKEIEFKIQGMPGAQTMWNKLCAGKTGEDVTTAVRYMLHRNGDVFK